MRARYSLTIFLLVLLIMRGFTPARGLDRVLKVDGIMEVKGNTITGARMVVLSHAGEVDVRTTGLEHFTIDLELQTSYIFSFERKGCVTKQLYFDTRVPDGQLQHAPFEFPFKVTLESPPKGQSFEYANPVGNIHFLDKAADFVYDKDYSKVADPGLSARMKEVLAELDTPAPIAPGFSTGTAIITSTVSSVAEVSEPTDHFNIEVPTIRTAPPLVHPTGATAAAEVPEPTPTPPPPQPAPKIIVVPRVAPAPPPPPSITEKPAPVLRTISSSHNSERTEELFVERRSVTTVVRITKDDRLTEYKRVAHDYGQVFYFKNGESCSQLTYQQGIAQE